MEKKINKETIEFFILLIDLFYLFNFIFSNLSLILVNSLSLYFYLST